MPDISMCKNEDCLFKNRCFRYLAEPTKHRQAYADFQPRNIVIGHDGTKNIFGQVCDYFWDIEKMNSDA